MTANATSMSILKPTRVVFPRSLSINLKRRVGRVCQIAEPAYETTGHLATFVSAEANGFLFQPLGSTPTVLIASGGKVIPASQSHAIRARVDATAETIDLSESVWAKHSLGALADEPSVLAQQRKSTLESWKDAFSFVAEDSAAGVVGFRSPQLGALHAIHARWSVSDGPATVVMPTGTGKTETMLGIMLSARCDGVLVVVPTDALRTQIADKFLSLGLLKHPACKVLAPSVIRPIVGTLTHKPKTTDEVDELFAVCNVVVATSHIVGTCNEDVLKRMAEHCHYLFIDEAHHTEAPTWVTFKNQFRHRRILQFTATPFREDGKILDGEIIYKYPLKRAQEEGFFRPIRFRPVSVFSASQTKVDEAIAAEAIKHLREDFDRGHIVMARVDSKAAAERVFRIYAKYPEYKPVQLHTGIPTRDRESARRQILNGESRIVICVNMLGEGFDLPELKIAAFHDIRKTLAVTLQLAGRFTRSRPDLGDPVFIANTASIDVQTELRKLYTRDPDWNALLPEFSEREISDQISFQEFLKGFTDFTDEIPLKAVRPATSAIVYKTKCANWSPESFKDGISGIASCPQVHSAINHEKHTLVVVTAKKEPVSWTDVEPLFAWDWELYVVIWDPDQALLFINSSTNAETYRQLAEAIGGDDVELIKGQDVFRTFYGINRLRLQNVGLTEILGRNVRYTGRMGGDVEPAISEIQKGKAIKSVLGGSGFTGGEQITVGASRKGRIWSMRRERLDGLRAWCRLAGQKLLDSSIDTSQILAGTLETTTLTTRPTSMPISVDWPAEIYQETETRWQVEIDGCDFPLGAIGIELSSPSVEGPLLFRVFTDSAEAICQLDLSNDDDTPNYRFSVLGGCNIRIRRGERSEPAPIEQFFYDNPPMIWFADGSSLDGNQHVRPRHAIPPIQREAIQVWDWSQSIITTESQGLTKNPQSIQARVIRELASQDYTVVFDDDDAGEIADVVAIKVEGSLESPTAILCDWFHCKYSLAPTPGARVDDLYEVCGQAQKCISWLTNDERRTDTIAHLIRRHVARIDAGKPGRIEVGTLDELEAILEMSRIIPMRIKVHIVQPGLSKMKASESQLLLLAVTGNYLHETYQVDLSIVGSA